MLDYVSFMLQLLIYWIKPSTFTHPKAAYMKQRPTLHFVSLKFYENTQSSVVTCTVIKSSMSVVN